MRALRLGLSAPLALLLVSEGYPLGRLLLTPVIPGLAPPQAVAASRQETAYLMRAVLDTARIGLETGLAALAPAFLIAFVLERRSWRGEPLLAALPERWCSRPATS